LNYLAHLFLSDPHPESLVGNLLGDFARGVDLSGFSPRIQAGVALHFRVDGFTDAHPVVLESKRRIAAPHRRYAGVLVDIFYDHFLAVDWHLYAPMALDAFTGDAYRALAAHGPILPERMARTCAAMAAGDWLGSYREVESIDLVLRRMSRRLRRENDLGTGAAALRASYEPLREDFHRFFPELLAFARLG
jgi:acyl carrier protein phosphodiesterase